MFTLTPAQDRTKRFLEAYINDKGFAPSFDEIAEATGLSSKSGVHRIMVALEERGHIQRLPHRARAIRVIADAASGLSGKGE